MYQFLYQILHMGTLKKTEITTSIRHIAIFLKSGIPFRISKSRIRLVEKQEEGEEHRQFQSVMRFTQTQ